MHIFIIQSKFLKEAFDSILLKESKGIIHIINNEDDKKIKFQANYNNDIYISFTLDYQFLIDIQDFEPIALNYEQSIALQKLSSMYDSSIGFIDTDGQYDIFVSHTNIKLSMYIDETLEKEQYIYPPEPDKTIDFIDVDSNILYNCIKLTNNPDYLTPIKLDPKNNKIIIGDLIQSIIQLKKYAISQNHNVDNLVININPESILKFLENVKDFNTIIKIKVHTKLAFTINFNNNYNGEIYYYCGY